MRRAAFIDRDGVVIEYVPDITRPDELEIFEFSAKAVKLLNDLGLLVIIVTNQPQIAKGVTTESFVKRSNKWIMDQLAKKGAVINAAYYCPHHPDKGFPGELPKYKIECDCRKPKIGMIEKAAKRFRIDVSGSFIIGDATADIKMAENARAKYPRIRSILVKTGLAGKDGKFNAKPDFKADNLLSAAELIESLTGVADKD